MDLLVNTLMSELDSLHENGVRLNAIGDLDSLPDSCRNTLHEAIRQTAKNDRITLTLALSYSSRWELVRMVKRLAQAVKEGGLEVDAIDDQLVSEHLTTSGMPDPELSIRTSGEQRISNFLLWQIAYAELWFSPVLWPDFRREPLSRPCSTSRTASGASASPANSSTPHEPRAAPVPGHLAGPSFAQKLKVPAMDYAFPKEYTIGGITVSGCVSREPNAVKLFSGLQVGDKITIPGQKITDAIKNIWAAPLQ